MVHALAQPGCMGSPWQVRKRSPALDRESAGRRDLEGRTPGGGFGSFDDSCDVLWFNSGDGETAKTGAGKSCAESSCLPHRDADCIECGSAAGNVVT